MSRVCEICGKGHLAGKQVSFAENKSNKSFEVNLQSVTIEENGKPKKVRACAKCIRNMKKA